MSRAGFAAPRVHGGRDREGARRGEVDRRHGGDGGAQCRDCRTRERMQGEDRAAVRNGDALPRRGLPPLSLQDLERRPPGVRAGSAPRGLRGRSGQLRLSSLRSRFFAAARLREGRGDQAGALPQVGEDGGQGRRPGVRGRASGIHGPAGHGGAACLRPRHPLPPHACEREPGAQGAAGVFGPVAGSPRGAPPKGWSAPRIG